MCTGTDNTEGDHIVPATVGPDYELTLALAPLGELGVQSDVSIVSGIRIPWVSGDNIPPAGKSTKHHFNTLGAIVAGTKCINGGKPNDSSADVIVADELRGDTAFDLLPYRVQASSYLYDNTVEGGAGTLSYRNVDGSIKGVTPTFSPRLAFESLFTGFIPPDPAEAEKVKYQLKKRKSVLDFITEDTAALAKTLGTADRQRLEQHLDEVRALEQRVSTIAPTGGACAMVPDPGEDPSIGGSIHGGDIAYNVNEGYSGEEERAQVMTDLIAMAFACDLSRVSSLMLTWVKSYMNAHPATGASRNIHGLSHSGGQFAEGTGLMLAWHVRHFGRLIQKLRDTPDVDGTSLLDHTAAVLMFEAGWGQDSGDPNKPLSSHSTENMSALIAGRAGGLKGGVHVVAPGKHPANVVLTAMRAVGVDRALGDLSDPIDELLV
jgi:hypothetical protein